MRDELDEEEELRAVTLQNARSILLARRRAEEELLRTREALHKQSESLRVTLASIGDGVITTDTDGRITGLNAVAESLTGWAAQEARDRPLADVFNIINEGTRERVVNPATRALREGRVVGLANHTILIARDGSEIPIDDSAAPIRDEQGEVHGVVLVFRSIAERKRAEEVQGRLAALVATSQDAIVSKTLDGQIQSWNEGAEQIFGYQLQEIIGQQITILIPPERHDEERMILSRIRNGERVEHYETVRITKRGERIDVSLSISPIRDSTGRVIGASKILRDISAKKRAEQRLAIQTQVTHLLAESTSLEEAAPKLLQVFCAHSGWLVGALWYVDEEAGVLRCGEVYHPSDVDVPRFESASRQRTFAKGVGLPGRVWASGAAQYIFDVVRDDNFLRAAIADAEHLHGALGFPIRLKEDVLGVMEFFSDKRRQPDQELLAMMTGVGVQLGQFIERRRAEAALRASEQRLLATLREADRRKDEFLAMLAHELRNPLAPIRNAVEIFRAKGSPVPELRWSAEVIDRQVHHMTRLVDDLLDVSRITRGRIDLRKQRVDVRTILSTALEASRPLIEKWGHQLSVTVPEQPIWLLADPVRLAQVIANLLNNAAKYTDHGGHIAVRVDTAGDHVAISVRDNGVGIPADARSRIFDMFAQVEKTIERSEGGLGIGLTLVQRLVELHGGSVEVQSDGVGQGSEFTLRLPIADPNAPAGRLDSPDQKTVVAPARRILIVDDNHDAADSLGMLLRMYGNKVQTAYDGLEAVGAAAAFEPDVVLLDIGLPKLSGYEAARRIRAQEGGSRLLLIAMTGWGQEEDRRASREAGFDHHMTKPVEFAALQQLLAETSAKSAARSGAP